MKVLFLAPLPEPITGQSLASEVFLEALREENEVEVVDMTKSSFKQGMSSIGRVGEVLAIVARARRLRRWADVVYLTLSESRAGNLKDLLICAACWGRLHRMVVHLHGGAGLRVLLGGGRWLTRAVNHFFLRRLGAVVVLGERHVGVFDGLVSPERIRVVPNFAADELFITAPAVEAKFAATRPLRLLFLSNLLPGKGHHELVGAYAALDETRRGALEIDFAGGFETDRERRRFERSMESFPRLRYHGTVRGEAKRRLLAAAHVFCLPTYYPYEGQPISILEAYASGCAVVTTDHSGVFDVFADGVNGLAVEKRSVSSLAAALEALLEKPDALRRMALENLHTAGRRYRAGEFNARLLRVLGEVAARPASA